MNGHIRQIHATETQTILPLVHRTTRESYSSFYPSEAIDFFIAYHSPENVRKDIENGFTITLIHEGTVVGTGTLLCTNIRRVFVLPEFQGSGYGEAIMDRLEQTARDRGFDFVELDASLPARRFYENRGYRTLKFCSIPVADGLTLDYHRMAKMVRKIKQEPRWNLHERQFRVIRNDGPGAEVDADTAFSFFQQNEMVMGIYSGGKIKEGELIGFIEGDSFAFHYQQENIGGQRSSGSGSDRIETIPGGKLQLIDHWRWESREGEGLCILEEK